MCQAKTARLDAPGVLQELDELCIWFRIEPVFHESNPWPRPVLAVLLIESLGIVFRKTVLKRTLRRTSRSRLGLGTGRAGLNPEPLNVEPEQFRKSQHLLHPATWLCLRMTPQLEITICDFKLASSLSVNWNMTMALDLIMLMRS